MFSRFKSFVTRHKKKFIVTGIVVGGSVIALRYAQRKLREFQESQASELIEKARRSCHFDSTEQTCNQTVMSLAPNLFENLFKLCDTESLLEQIRQNPENKLELWDELKILSFTRVTAIVYASSMFVVTLRVQLNLLGGYLYKDSTAMGDAKISDEIKQVYLSLIQYYLKDGIYELYKVVELNVRKILQNYNLKQKLTLSEIEQVFWSIQMAINSDKNDPNSSLSNYVLPKKVDENPLLNKMFSETLDILESDEVAYLNTTHISRGFSQLIDSIAEFYTEPNYKTNSSNNNITYNNTNGLIGKNGTNQIIEINQNQPSTSKADLNKMFDINQIDIQLAKLIPIINGLGSKNFSNTAKPPSLTTTLITLYILSDKVKMLGANVYEGFSQ